MSKHNTSSAPLWQRSPHQWQAQLLANPHLTPAEKLTFLALRRRFVDMTPVAIDLEELACETAQTVEAVRAHLQRWDGVTWKVLPDGAEGA